MAYKHSKLILIKPTPQLRVLLLKRCHASEGDSSWDLPGGGVRNGETPLTALHREIKEEIGDVEIEYADFRPITWKHSSGGLGVTHLGKYLSGQIRLSREHTAWKWCDLGTFVKLLSRSPMGTHYASLYAQAVLGLGESPGQDP